MATNHLKKFSDEQLLEELCRRQRVRLERDERLAFKPCDECKHFIFWTSIDRDPPDDYNPCSKGYQMKFRMPEGYNPSPSEYGFYRRVCAHREARESQSNG